MKELHGQTLSNEIAESDRLAAGIPGQVAAKNILFSNFWAQLKSIFGVNNWSAREYKSSPCIVVYNKAQYILDESVAPLPFNSTDFTTELASNIWVPLGSSISVATNTDIDEATDDTRFVSSVKLNYALVTKVFSGLTASILDTLIAIVTKLNPYPSIPATPTGLFLRDDGTFASVSNRTLSTTAWVATDTALTLTYLEDKDFATGTPVSIITTVTITLTPQPSGLSANYWFKFKAGTGWGFVWPSGYTAAPNNDPINAGSTYEVDFKQGVYIIRKVA